MKMFNVVVIRSFYFICLFFAANPSYGTNCTGNWLQLKNPASTVSGCNIFLQDVDAIVKQGCNIDNDLSSATKLGNAAFDSYKSCVSRSGNNAVYYCASIYGYAMGYLNTAASLAAVPAWIAECKRIAGQGGVNVLTLEGKSNALFNAVEKTYGQYFPPGAKTYSDGTGQDVMYFRNYSVFSTR